jgi:hypothetical protein
LARLIYAPGVLAVACTPVTVPEEATKVYFDWMVTCVPHERGEVAVHRIIPSLIAPVFAPHGFAVWNPPEVSHPKSVNRITVPAVISFNRTKENSSSCVVPLVPSSAEIYPTKARSPATRVVCAFERGDVNARSKMERKRQKPALVL